MSFEEFEKYIESIGFKYYKKDSNSFRYEYKSHLGLNKYRIDIYYDIYNGSYDFYNGYKWFGLHAYNDLRHIEKEFKKELRSIKLKGLLG